MQTFLPVNDFMMSAMYLDNRRLNKQITETKQIWLACTFGRSRWKNHPAVKMWKGYETCLLWYGKECYIEWQDRLKRGVRGGNLCHNAGEEMFVLVDEDIIARTSFSMPPWLGDERFHSAHRAALLAKDYKYYSQFNWGEEPGISYYWPV